MKFECKPQLFLTKEEFNTLDKALKLCRDMDSMTSGDTACEICPITDDCIGQCVYVDAYKALKKIIDIAIVK